MAFLRNIIVTYCVIVVLFGLHHYAAYSPDSTSYVVLKHASMAPFYIWAMILEIAKMIQQTMIIILIKFMIDICVKIFTLMFDLFHGLIDYIVIPLINFVKDLCVKIFTLMGDLVQGLIDYMVIPLFNFVKDLCVKIFTLMGDL